jgi:hypothetical protein
LPGETHRLMVANAEHSFATGLPTLTPGDGDRMDISKVLALFLCVCFVYVCVYLSVLECAYVCLCLLVCACVCLCMRVCAFVCAYMYVSVCACV